ncbi:hypothetical protein [Burkholderia sp. 3C]
MAEMVAGFVDDMPERHRDGRQMRLGAPTRVAGQRGQQMIELHRRIADFIRRPAFLFVVIPARQQALHRRSQRVMAECSPRLSATCASLANRPPRFNSSNVSNQSNCMSRSSK